MCTTCRTTHKQSVARLSCASGRGHVGTCPHIRHKCSDTAGLSSAGAHEFTPEKAADAHCPFVTRQRVERGVGWVEGISMDRIPRVIEVSRTRARTRQSLAASQTVLIASQPHRNTYAPCTDANMQYRPQKQEAPYYDQRRSLAWTGAAISLPGGGVRSSAHGSSSL